MNLPPEMSCENVIMSTDITVSLPDTLCERAQEWAQRAGRTLPDFLGETIELSLLPLGTPAPVEEWTDEDVLRASDDFFSPDDDRRLSELLSLQRESTLDTAGRAELSRLMQE